MKEMWVRPLGWEDPQEKERATHSGIFAWDITWTEEPGGLYPQGYKESGMTQQLNHNTKQMFSEKKMPPLKPVHWSSQCGSRLPLYLEEQPCPAKAVGFSTGGTPSCETHIIRRASAWASLSTPPWRSPESHPFLLWSSKRVMR